MPESQRQKQKLQTRQRIIEAAINQISKNGLVKVRTSDIADEANVSHGSIFAHFPTRDELLDAAIEEFGLNCAGRLHELVGSNCTLEEILNAHLIGISENEGFYTEIVKEVHQLNTGSRNALIMVQSAISFHFTQVIQKEISEGKIKDMPVELLFNTWIGLIHYYLINQDLFAPGGSVIKRYGKQLIDYYIKLLIKEDDL